MKHRSYPSKPILWLFLVVCAGFIISSCSSTRMVDTWDGADPSVRPLKRLLILGMFTSDLHRKVVEDRISKALTPTGSFGINGYSLIPDVAAYKDQKDVREAVESARADGVVLVSFRGKTEQKRNIPPQVDYVPTFGISHRLYDYYGVSHRAVYTPGYTVTDTLLDLELTLFDAHNGEMLWAGATQTRNPSSASKVAEEAGKLMIKELKKKKLL